MTHKQAGSEVRESGDTEADLSFSTMVRHARESTGEKPPEGGMEPASLVRATEDGLSPRGLAAESVTDPVRAEEAIPCDWAQAFTSAHRPAPAVFGGALEACRRLERATALSLVEAGGAAPNAIALSKIGEADNGDDDPDSGLVDRVGNEALRSPEAGRRRFAAGRARNWTRSAYAPQTVAAGRPGGSVARRARSTQMSAVRKPAFRGRLDVAGHSSTAGTSASRATAANAARALARAPLSAASGVGAKAVALALALSIAVFGGLACCAASGPILAGIVPSNDDRQGFSATESMVADFLLAQGLDEIHVAAILGNMRQESGVDPSRNQDLESTPYAGSGPADRLDRRANVGHGLCQWGNPERFDRLIAYAVSSTGKDAWEDPDLQLKYLWYEMSGQALDDYVESSGAAVQWTSPSSWTGFLQAETIEEATRYFRLYFERGGAGTDEERIEHARRYYATLVHGTDYIRWAVSVAEDDAVGYSWGNARSGEYDCQGLVKAALEQAGYTAEWSYTGNMGAGLVAAGFARHPYNSAQLQPGDILLYHYESGGTYEGHAAIYLGDGLIVEAIKDHDGIRGDSSGEEVRVTSNWATARWQHYFRIG